MPGDLQSTISSHTELPTSLSAGSTATLTGITSTRKQEGLSEPKGMQLGKGKTNANTIAAQLLEETPDSGSIWGNDTSNDIFADDWG